jgi:hypothetical protein
MNWEALVVLIPGFCHTSVIKVCSLLRRMASRRSSRSDDEAWEAWEAEGDAELERREVQRDKG